MRRARIILQKDLGYTLPNPRRRHFPTLPVVVFNINEQWAADLIKVINIVKYNKGYCYPLTVVDVFSKYTWVEPVKSKTGQAVTEAFEEILKQGRTPVNLQADDGKEIYNKTFQGLMSCKGIHHFSTSGDTKASVVERFNRALKLRLYRYFTVKNTLSYVPVLQSLVKGYNRSYHRSIKMAPDKVTLENSPDVWNQPYGKQDFKRRKRPTLKVGDRVRMNKNFRQFKKGYLPGWTEEVFVVRTIHKGKVPMYKVEEWGGAPI